MSDPHLNDADPQPGLTGGFGLFSSKMSTETILCAEEYPMLTCETEKCTNDTLLTPNIRRICVVNPDPMILDLPDPDLA
jgi:hypothetical protein